MSVAHEDFEQINQVSLETLIGNGIPEGLLIEYKRDLYERNDAGIKEFLKDVTAFANGSGGHLIIGIDEVDGIATQIVPIAGIAVDPEIQRLEQLIRDGVEPRIIGVRVRAVTVVGGVCILLRIPGSWNPPHRVTAKNTSRFFMRNTSGAHELSVEELRVLFNKGATAHERLLAFRCERVALIQAGETPTQVNLRPAVAVLHIVPLLSPRSASIPDINRNINRLDDLRPMHTRGSHWQFNFEGVLTYDSSPDRASYLQLFRNGALEAVQASIGTEGQLPAQWLERMVLTSLLRFLRALHAADVVPPLAVMLTLMRVRGLRLAAHAHHHGHAFDRDVYELPPAIINELGNDGDYDPLLQPVFDAMWQAAGEYQSPNFDQKGAWLRRGQ